MENIAKSLCVALGERDKHTRQHCDRVVDLALALGRHIELTHRELSLLALGAQFHDIGKIGIPDHLLSKPAPFVESEWAHMKQHPEIGERIILALEGEHTRELACIVRHHHERFDGSGYPDRLSGTDIPLLSRVIALVDNYDAMAESRPYHHGRSHEQVMTIMDSETGSKHDPDLMHAFRALIDQPAFGIRPN